MGERRKETKITLALASVFTQWQYS